MDVIHEVSLGSCAKEVLRNNKLHTVVFATAVRELLTLGHAKYQNIIIVGPSNYSKMFLLKPLESIIKAFANPVSSKYVEADNAQITFLNDFRWSP